MPCLLFDECVNYFDIISYGTCDVWLNTTLKIFDLSSIILELLSLVVEVANDFTMSNI